VGHDSEYDLHIMFYSRGGKPAGLWNTSDCTVFYHLHFFTQLKTSIMRGERVGKSIILLSSSSSFLPLQSPDQYVIPIGKDSPMSAKCRATFISAKSWTKKRLYSQFCYSTEKN
jgi:hypothetical protein